MIERPILLDSTQNKNLKNRQQGHRFQTFCYEIIPFPSLCMIMGSCLSFTQVVELAHLHMVKWRNAYVSMIKFNHILIILTQTLTPADSNLDHIIS